MLVCVQDILARHIRAVAPKALIFFSGAVGDRTGDAGTDTLPLGFTAPPGGLHISYILCCGSLSRKVARAIPNIVKHPFLVDIIW